MKYSQIFTKTEKQAKEYDSLNATLLIKAGFIYQIMAGAYTFLPLGLRVLNKIEQIVREEMDKIASEISMTALAPKSLWETTGRINTVDVLMKTVAANESALAKNAQEYILNSTQEELVTPIAQKFAISYKDLPFATYQIQTKFRNEARVKSGLMRGREFRMKDLYSFHRSEEELKKYYEVVKKAYVEIFKRLGLGDQTVIALASGGDFTKDYSHEFQTRCETGEDIIYKDLKTNIYYNKEVAPPDADDTSKFEKFTAAEVGNIFPLNTKFSQAFNYYFTDQDGSRKIVYMGCYGIGTSRIMGVIAEKFNDEKGLIWPESIAPFQVYLISINDKQEAAQMIYDQLTQAKIEVLWDDREVSAGLKFADADLIGCPNRLVISEKTGDQIEWKQRTSQETQLLSLDQVIKKLST